MGFMSPVELSIISGIVILLFGTKKLPELGRGLGEALIGLRKGLKEIEHDDQ